MRASLHSQTNTTVSKETYSNTLPFVPSPQGRGDDNVPSPLEGEGKGEGECSLTYILSCNALLSPLGLRGGWGSYFDQSARNDSGVTLIELLIVISVIVILIVALGFSFEGWIGKYRVETQVKEMYVDFTNARARAMERNRMHFVAGTNTTYSVYEDTNPGPDGNEALETGSDTRLPTFPKTVQYPIDWTATGTEIDFNTDGMIDITPASGATSGSIFVTTTNDSDYDCINISPTKIYMGKKNAATASCDSK